jgi:hypothetical protein
MLEAHLMHSSQGEEVACSWLTGRIRQDDRKGYRDGIGTRTGAIHSTVLSGLEAGSSKDRKRGMGISRTGQILLRSGSNTLLRRRIIRSV